VKRFLEALGQHCLGAGPINGHVELVNQHLLTSHLRESIRGVGQGDADELLGNV
jgi:hypothetical protein